MADLKPAYTVHGGDHGAIAERPGGAAGTIDRGGCERLAAVGLLAKARQRQLPWC